MGTEASCTDDFVTFGWSDFPLLGTTAAKFTVVETTSSATTPCFLEMEPSEGVESCSSASSSEDEGDNSEFETMGASTIAIRRRRRRLGVPKHNVSFTSIDVREYNVVLGDHDFPEDGLPLSLGWDYVEHTSIQVDDYEELRRYPFPNRRPQKLGYYERKNRLKRVSGYSESELRHMERERQELATSEGQLSLEFWSSTTMYENGDDILIRASPSSTNLLDYQSTV